MPVLLIGTDLSARSDRAVRRGVSIARQTGCELELVHIVDEGQPKRLIDAAVTKARSKLEKASATLLAQDGVVSRTSVRVGERITGLAEAALIVNAELIIIGPHRKRPFQDLFLGTVAGRLVGTSGVPVLVAAGQPSAEYQRIVIATDLEPYSAIALQAASRIPFTRDAELSVLYLYDPIGSDMMSRSFALERERRIQAAEEAEQARQKLDEFLESASPIKGRAVVRPLRGSVAPNLQSVAEELNSDVIVMAAGDKSPLSKLLVGSSVDAVLNETDRDVLVIGAKVRGAWIAS